MPDLTRRCLEQLQARVEALKTDVAVLKERIRGMETLMQERLAAFSSRHRAVVILAIVAISVSLFSHAEEWGLFRYLSKLLLLL